MAFGPCLFTTAAPGRRPRRGAGEVVEDVPLARNYAVPDCRCASAAEVRRLDSPLADRNRAAPTPSAAKIRLGCGPESPIAIGKGGNSNAALRKSATTFPAPPETRGPPESDRRRDSIAFIATAAVRATAAAQIPRVSGSHDEAGHGGMAMLLIGGVHVSRITRAPPGDALLLIIHFHRQVHRRQHQTEQQCRQ